MATTVTLRDLSRGPGRVVDQLRQAREPAVLTERGRPVGILIVLDPDELEDFVFSRAPEFVNALRAADAELARGETQDLDEVLAELDDGD